MRPQSRASTVRRQPTPQELVDELLRFVETKFYEGDPIGFIKDRRRLLAWVILRLAKWLDDRGVSISTEAYREIMIDKILMTAVRHGDTGNIQYRPAWLAKVVESHLDHHGEEYYEHAKAIRNVVEHALLVAGRLPLARPDPVRDLAAARRLLTVKKRPSKRRGNDQLTLL
jgi:hypothetical protein